LRGRDPGLEVILEQAVLRSDPSRPVVARRRFVLYVEGPSDCEILRTWALLLSPALARAVAHSSVILGGRRPMRALEHFGGLPDAATVPRRADERARAVCVLDGDGLADPVAHEPLPAGFEFFTWPRRQIESYLLVPMAIRRCMRASARDNRPARLLAELLPDSCDEQAMRDLDAKRLLDPKGSLARRLGVSISPAGIARQMNRSDLHPDVLCLLGRLQRAVGMRESHLEDAVGG
jgi:hypothetical protein